MIIQDYPLIDLILLGTIDLEEDTKILFEKLNTLHNVKGGKKIAIVSMNIDFTNNQRKRFDEYEIFAFLQKPIKKSELLGIIKMIK